MNAIERFEAKVLKTDGCWLWQAGCFSKGYGSFWLDQRNRTAHHVAYELYVGPVPEGLIVCHSCDVRRCVNPAHLFTGTHADNAADKVAKGRHYKGGGHQWSGKPSPRRKLTDADVNDLHVLLGFGVEQKALAKEYGVGTSTISRVARRVWGSPPW